jgi:hypothetical protein
MDRKKLITVISVAAVLAISGCSSGPTPAEKAGTEAKQEQAKTPEAVAARAVYFEMYKQARAWAPDLLALTLKSGEAPTIKNTDGKAGLWTAVFVSPSRKEARTFSYAVAENGLAIRKGINVSDKQTWAGATTASRAFTNAEFSIDSDAAYKAGAAKAASWLKTHPNVKAELTLGSSARFPGPVWYIMWGTSKSGYAAYVDATTGAVLNK